MRGSGRYIVAIDQGTTSTRAIVFDENAAAIATAQTEFAQHYPHPGWVEHDPADIWNDTQSVVQTCLAKAEIGAGDVAAIGITNQRETTVIWDRKTGEPIHNAIVWQDRRGEPLCRQLREAGQEDLVRARSGLLLDPYFSATKVSWLLENVDGARRRAEAGELAFGTMDTFLLWHLTGGKVHATDATNASRTMLFDIHAGDWSAELCELFGVPMAILPQVRDSAGIFGTCALFGAEIPVAGIAGDQQAALFGQGCFEPGQAKATYGTGCFLLVNSGTNALASQNRLLTTVACRLNGQDTYALEGSIFVAGAAIKWLRDGLGLITHASQTDDMATRVSDNGGVYLVPAFAGLGAPHWRADARALLTGMTLGTDAAHVARAALESVAYQTMDLVDAMREDGANFDRMRIDGGMAANDWFARFLAGMLDMPVDRPAMLETTARGAAMLAGHGVGLWPDMAALKALAQENVEFNPSIGDDERSKLRREWHAALGQALSAG